MISSITRRPRTFWPQGLSYILDVAASSHRRAIAFLIVVSLLAFLPGFSRVPPIDREEARFAQATKQMVESGEYIDIRFQDEFRYSKPIGLYWLQAIPAKIASVIGGPTALSKIWIYRIPSLIGAIGAVLATYWTALAFVSRRSAVLAGAMIAGSILVGIFARLATTDAMQLAAITFAMGALARAYRWQWTKQAETPPGPALAAIFWTAIAAGILLKGPIIILFVGLTILALGIADRSWRWLRNLRPLPGLLWCLVLVSPWLIAIVMKSGRFFFQESIGDDFFGRIFSASEFRFVPPGFYLVTFFVTFWPASLLAGLAAPAIWRTRYAPPTRFLLAWLVPAWLLFELIWAKLPHFVLPLFPAIAILIAGCVETYQLSDKRWMERGTFWWFALPVIVAVVGIVLLIRIEGSLGLAAWPLAAAAVIFAFRAWWLYDADGAERSLLRAIAASLFLSAALYSSIIPALQSLFPSTMLARAVRNSECPMPEVASAGLNEPSLVFLMGTQTQLTDGVGAADFLRKGGCRFAFVEGRFERSFAQRADAIGLRYTRGPRLDAVNVPRGRWMTIAIFRATEQP